MKNEKNAKAKKESKKAAGKAKLPAGTPKASKDAGYGAFSTTDPPVPNRAHTEM